MQLVDSAEVDVDGLAARGETSEARTTAVADTATTTLVIRNQEAHRSLNGVEVLQVGDVWSQAAFTQLRDELPALARRARCHGAPRPEDGVRGHPPTPEQLRHHSGALSTPENDHDRCLHGDQRRRPHPCVGGLCAGSMYVGGSHGNRRWHSTRRRDGGPRRGHLRADRCRPDSPRRTDQHGSGASTDTAADSRRRSGADRMPT